MSLQRLIILPYRGAGDDIDAHLARTSAKSSAQASPLLEAPPPYTYSDVSRGFKCSLNSS